jgi:sugar/nucleoside kinase (ribokinase family)
MIVVIGSIALDTTRLPTKTVKEIMGGSGTYFSISATFFSQVGLVGVVGNDYPQKYWRILNERVDLEGVQIKKGKTFRYDSRFDMTLTKRTTIKTELNVFEDFKPAVPDGYKTAEYVYLGNIDPDQQLKVLDQMYNPTLVVADTIALWIKTKPEKVKEVISKMNGLLINDEEVRLICGVSNLIKGSKIILGWGVDFVVIKKGEHGALLCTQETIFPSPAYPLESVVDTTGAGDAFAGGFMGHIARKGKVDERTMKEAMIYGNIMGSFVVEDYSVNRLLTLTNREIENRYQKYKNMLKF